MTKPDSALSRLVLRAAPLAAAGLVLSLTACGGSAGHNSAASSPASSPASSTPSGPMLGATFTGTIYVSTPTSHVTKAFSDHVADVQNCAAAAETGWGGTFHVPSPQAPDPEADIEVSGFHGPGTYTPTMLQRDHADSILLTGKTGTSQYLITTPLANRTPGKEVLFLQKDGSGQLVYSGAHLDGQASDPTVAGLISWNCSS
ncbi:MAG: hypothetical protein WAK71_03930 [Streptosporangiaceae bacterium]|jgi:hypothetical protein